MEWWSRVGISGYCYESKMTVISFTSSPLQLCFETHTIFLVFLKSSSAVQSLHIWSDERVLACKRRNSNPLTSSMIHGGNPPWSKPLGTRCGTLLTEVWLDSSSVWLSWTVCVGDLFFLKVIILSSLYSITNFYLDFASPSSNDHCET